MRKLIGIFLLIMIMVIAGCSSGGSDDDSGDNESASKDDFPKKDFEFIAPATPGGGWDATARAMQKIFKDEGITDNNINVVNKPGGGGEVGWQYLESKDAHHIAINSSLVITNNILGQSELTYEDFTPLAILTTEWNAVTVAPESEIESGADVMEKLKEDPSSLKIAVAPSLGNDDHLSFVKAAKEFGVDVTKLNFLIYESGGDVLTAMLGNHVDVATSSVSEFAEQHKAGKVKMVAVTSEERLEDYPDVPTWKEQGVDMVFPHWRGVMGPPDMTDEELAYWDDKIGEMVETDAWGEVLKNNDWEDYYKDSTESKTFLEEQTEQYQDLLNLSGLLD